MTARSIRARLTTSYVLLVSVCLILVATYVTWRLQSQYMTTYRSVILTQSRLISSMLQEYAGEGNNTAASLERLSQQFRWRPDMVITVRDAGAIARQGMSASPELRAALGGEAAQTVRDDPQTRQQRVFAAAPVTIRGRTVAVVHLSVPTGWVWTQLRRMIPQLGIALAIGLLAAWVVGTRLARSVAEPIDDLAQVAAQMGAGDLTRTVRPRGPDEIGRLGEIFNRMAERLRATITTLSAEQTKLAAVVGGIVDGVIATNRDGGILLANRAAKDLLGWPESNDNASGGQIPWPRLRAVLEEAALHGRVCAEELPPAQTGNRLIEVHCAPIAGNQGGPAGAVAVLRDVTDLRRLERARRDLTANVSHELRTPLTSIKGFAETLLAGAMRDEQACRRFLDIIDQEANRLVKLVDDLLDLSQLESKRLSLEVGQVKVGDIVADTVTRMKPLAGRRALELRPAGEEVTVVADRDRLAQILTNLVDNAIKFTPDDGRIAVGWRTLNGEVEVSVADSGPGIPAADLPHVFERFYKADRARASGGTGLGLAITKHIVEAHGGRIRVASTPGAGTTFAFTLPRDAD